MQVPIPYKGATSYASKTGGVLSLLCIIISAIYIIYGLYELVIVKVPVINSYTVADSSPLDITSGHFFIIVRNMTNGSFEDFISV